MLDFNVSLYVSLLLLLLLLLLQRTYSRYVQSCAFIQMTVSIGASENILFSFIFMYRKLW